MGERPEHNANADDIRFMERALALAANGAGLTAPNPMVGCVLVADGEIVAEGWHKGAGRPHAEVEALRAAGGRARSATAYVTLEPCNHHGRTGPCAEALIEAGVAKVVYAMGDPNRQASGGAARLAEAGIGTRRGVCGDAAQALNRYWLHKLHTGRPYVVAKFAASLDGKIATHTGDSQWITGPAARGRGHDLRAEVDGIVVGADTVIADDPALTARPAGRDMRRPLRIVLDSRARTSPGAHVFDRAGNGALLAATDAAPQARLDAFREHGVDVLTLPKDENARPDIEALLETLSGRGLNAVMVEGGGAVLGAFFDAGLVDEVWAFIAPVVIGGPAKAPVGGAGAASLAEALRLSNVKTEMLGDDILVRGLTAASTNNGSTANTSTEREAR